MGHGRNAHAYAHVPLRQFKAHFKPIARRQGGMTILVLGGYGMIGAAAVRALSEAGLPVAALGRAPARAMRQMPEVAWHAADLAHLTSPEAWQTLLARIRPTVVINCAGALQDGLRDDVATVHLTAMRALYAAAPRCGVTTLVQISAPRAAPGASTAFMATKGEADALLQASTLDWTILRPGLVLGPDAYGGTALLRALAAFPLIRPVVFEDRLVQTVAVDDVAKAIVAVVQGRIPSRHVYDLMEDEPHTMAHVVDRMRAWLGLPPGVPVRVPLGVVRACGRVADALGWLGWRSPLRSTAIAEVLAGISGDPAPWRVAGGAAMTPLDTTLRRMPAGVQERWFARAFLLKPLVIAVLALFWLASGLIALAVPDAAAEVLTERGLASTTAATLVYSGAVLDLVLGVGILIRRLMPTAALGMIALSLGYVMAGTALAPDLWADPLGPLLKILPTMTLALVALAFAEDR